MKKILLLIILLIPINIKAATYYTDYYEIPTKEESELVKKEEVKLYNTYKEEKKNIGYKENCNNFYEEDFEIEVIENKEQIDNSFIPHQSIYVGDSLPLISLKLFNIVEDIKLDDIEILYDKNKIDYQISKESLEFKKGETVDISFKELDDIEKLEIKFIGKEPIKTNLVFVMMKNGRPFYFETIINTKTIDIVDFNTYYDLYLKYGCYDNTDIVKTYYKKEIKKYMCYEVNKVPQNIYVEDGENLLLEDFKITHKYFKRDFITISDKTLNKKQNLLNLIESTSFNKKDIKIEDNIDYTKSGTYNIKFIINNNIFNHKINYVKETNITPLIKTEYIEIEKECEEYSEKQCEECEVKEYKEEININPLLIIIIICLILTIIFLRKNKDND